MNLAMRTWMRIVGACAFAAIISACANEPTASRPAAATGCPPEPTTLDSHGEPRNAAGDVRYCWPGEAFCYCDSDNDCYARTGYVPCTQVTTSTTTACPPEATTLDSHGEPRNSAGDVRYCWPGEANCHCDSDNDCYAATGYVPCSSRDAGTQTLDAGPLDSGVPRDVIDVPLDGPRDVIDVPLDAPRDVIDVALDTPRDTSAAIDAGACPPEPTTPDANGEPRNAAGDIRYCWPWEAFCHCDSDNDCYAREGYVPCSAQRVDAGSTIPDAGIDTGSTTRDAGIDTGTAPPDASPIPPAPAPAGAPLVTIDTTRDRGAISRDLYGIDVGDSTQSIAPVMSFAATFPLIRFPGGDEPQQFRWDSTSTGACGDRVNWPIIADLLTRNGMALVMETNLVRSTPENAAAWVADARARGIRVPFVTIGNEAFGDWDESYRTATRYASDLRAHAAAIHARTPEVRIGAAYGTHNDDAWNREMVRNAADVIDVVEYHYYPNHREYERAIPSEIMAEPEAVPSMLGHIRSILREEAPAYEPHIEIALGEFDCAEDPPSDPYDLVAGRAYSQWAMPNAVCYGAMIGEFIEAGVRVALMYDLQGYRFGSTRGKECEPGNTALRRPKVLAQQLYREHFGDRLVAVSQRDVPTYVSNGPIWWDGYAGVAPYLKTYASLAEEGRSLRVVVVSRQPTASMSVNFALQGFDPVSVANVWELAGDSVMATNENVGGPIDAVHIVQRTAAVTGANFTYVVPPHSVSAIEIRRR